MDNTYTPYILLCEASKQEGDVENHYELKVAALEDNIHQLHTNISHALSASGYHLMSAGEAELVNLHMQASPVYDADALTLWQQVSADNPIAFKKIRRISTTGEAATIEPDNYLIVTEHDIPPLPNQEHLAFWQKEWIAPELKTLLFAQPASHEDNTESPVEQIRTYLIVDAHLYLTIKGVLDLPHLNNMDVRCLFKGKAAEELRLTAPYLIDMTLPEGAGEDANQVSLFHKYYLESQWQHGTGIFIRSTASMDTIHHHFRKFTQYQSDDGKHFFFRFWETNNTYDYFKQVSVMPERAKGFFRTRKGPFIHSIVSYAERTERLYEVKPQQAILEKLNVTEKPFTITAPEEHALLHGLLRPFVIGIQQQIVARYPDYFVDTDTRQTEEEMLAMVVRLHGYGFYNIGYLEELVENSIFFGKNFLEKDTTGALLAIAQSDDNEERKFQALTHRLAECEDTLLGSHGENTL